MWRRFWPRKSSNQAPEEDNDERSIIVAELVRRGVKVELRSHIPANLPAFQRWYADPEIASLLRHDQEPLNAVQAHGYFESFILPLSAQGYCYAIHERSSGDLIGTTAITDITRPRKGRTSGLFRIVIGEKTAWGHGYGTESTQLVMAEAFEEHDLDEVRLEVFRHNPRAIAVYHRLGFQVTGEHVEWLRMRNQELRVLEMVLLAEDFVPPESDDDDEDDDLDWDDEDDDEPDDDAEDDDEGDVESDSLDPAHDDPGVNTARVQSAEGT